MGPRTRVVSDEIERQTVWDNFARHEAELTRIGAGPEHIARLRAAAEEVDKHEQAVLAGEAIEPGQPEAGLDELDAPVTLACGWQIAPPTMKARRAAALAVQTFCGGQEPSDGRGVTMSLVIGLWVLREWGEGRKATALAMAMDGNALAELAFDVLEEVVGSQADVAGAAEEVSDAYLRLMGFAKKNGAALNYLRALDQIRRELRGGQPEKSEPGKTE